MGPLDPGCFGCCIYFPMPKLIQQWMGIAPPAELSDPEQIRAWADAVFTGEPQIIVPLAGLPLGIGTLHQVADERGYKVTKVAEWGGNQGGPRSWQFDLINLPKD